MDLDNFGHVSLSELGLSVSEAVSFMKQICKFIPASKVWQIVEYLIN